jgi:undecaprenyl-diphosphatase
MNVEQRVHALGQHVHPERSALTEAAIEAIGGTSPGVHRGPVSPLRWLLPPALGRLISAFDRSAEVVFDQVRGQWAVDRLFYSASALADFSLLWHLVGASRALRTRHQAESVRMAAALGVESLLVNVGVKSLFRRRRPVRQEHQRHQLRQPRSSSFPSGHATSGFMAATLLSEGRSRLNRLGWYSLAGVVAASRVHVNIHHASDVVGGAVMGAGLGRLVMRIWPVPKAPRSSGACRRR